MKIAFCIPSPDDQAETWIEGFSQLLPEAQLFLWKESDPATEADYAVVRKPSPAFFSAHSSLKAVFNLGAGVEGLLKIDTLSKTIPIVKLDDAGMGIQMAEYVLWAVLRYFRQFDQYEKNGTTKRWAPLPSAKRADFPIGIMGLGVLGQFVGQKMREFGFDVYGWSASKKDIPGITSYAEIDEFDDFLSRTKILVCLLPLTPNTQGILNSNTLGKLLPQSYLINVGRGGHLVDEDLLAMLKSGHLVGATLDVFNEEPLSADHPFWETHGITVTPHISACIVMDDSIKQIVEKLRIMEKCEPVSGVIDQASYY